MDFGLYEKHETFIKERWLPISVDLMLQEGPEKKISFLKEAQQQASKEIQNIEEKSVFIGFLEIEILKIQNKLSKNGSTKAQIPAQSNETLNTGESHSTGEPVEKIDWEAGLAELTFVFEILFKNKEIGCSMKQYKKRWALIAKHFTVKGKEITSEGLRHAFSQLKVNKSEGMPRNHEIYEALLTMSQEIEDSEPHPL
uniref:Uncharacterized protein n=1 Tax=uncultured nuHF2 cluster bacterium HF0770_13K08 TaxID=723591 RepID=E7C715_9BACT|nr:hypothetical protein [uncultured nuHF2 cluster bacterium HF0770_13K08]